MPRLIGFIVSAGKATLHELQSVYSLRDAYELAEVILVDGVNQRRLTERARRRG